MHLSDNLVHAQIERTLDFPHFQDETDSKLSRISMWLQHKQESIQVASIPPACQLYMLWPPDIGASRWYRSSNEHAGQVSSADHQMLLVGGSHVWCLADHGACLTTGQEGPGCGALYSEVQGIMGNGHTMTPPLWTDRQTDMSQNITFQQLHWRAVNRNICKYFLGYHTVTAKYLQSFQPRTFVHRPTALLKALLADKLLKRSPTKAKCVRGWRRADIMGVILVLSVNPDVSISNS